MKRVLVLFVFVACGGASPKRAAEAPHQEEHRRHEHPGPGGHRFEKADDWAPMFDDPQRDEWQKPDAVVAALELRPGMTVADVGAGTGYFEARLAKSVGPEGTVLAVDVEPDMIRYLGERAKRESTPQVKPVLAAPDDPKLAPASVDRIVVVDTWHHLGDRRDYARRLAAALKPGGFVLVVDFTLETTRGPPKAHRLGPDIVGGELEAAGLFVVPVDIGLPDQYVLKGEKRL
jgi:predicted methyltransferase